MGWACGAYGWGEGVYRVLPGKPEGRRPLGRPRRRWVDKIRMDLQEVGCGYMDRIGRAQDRDRWRTLVSAVMNLRVPWIAGNILTSCKPISFSRRTLHRGVSKYIVSSQPRCLSDNSGCAPAVLHLFGDAKRNHDEPRSGQQCPSQSSTVQKFYRLYQLARWTVC